MPNISLLPEEMRKKQEQRKKSAPGNGGASGAFYVPEPTADSRQPIAVKPSTPAPIISSPPTPAPPESSASIPSVPATIPKPSAVPPRGNGKMNGTARRTNGRNGHTEGKSGRNQALMTERGSLHVPPAPAVSAGTARRISLIPGELRGVGASRWERGILIGSVVISIAVVLGAWYVLQAQITYAQSEVAEVEQQYTASQERVAKAINNLKQYEASARRADAVRTLLTSHRDWSAFFRILEGQTLPSASYQTLTADANGSVAVTVTVPSVRSATEQFIAWSSSPNVIGVESSGLSATVDEVGVVRGVRFDLRLKVSPDAFMYRE